MNRLIPLLALAALGCGDTSTGPSGLSPGYYLMTVNGQYLPTRDGDTPADAELISGSLSFDGSDRPRGDSPGTVSYSRWLRRSNQPLERVTIELHYQVDGGVLRINLCPPLALCIQSTELVGPVAGHDLVLTHYLGGAPGAVYRFSPALPE